jgi:hypothetical protein
LSILYDQLSEICSLLNAVGHGWGLFAHVC